VIRLRFRKAIVLKPLVNDRDREVIILFMENVLSYQLNNINFILLIVKFNELKFKQMDTCIDVDGHLTPPQKEVQNFSTTLNSFLFSVFTLFSL
jgi:hypothetical protein